MKDLAIKPKQEKFCLAFAKSGNIRQAYLEAGYKCSPESADASGSYLLKNPMVQQRLRELAEMAANEKIADAQEMQQILTRIIRKQMQEETIVVEGIGDGCSEARRMKKEPSLKDLINAINTLGKMQGVFDNSLNINIEPVTICNDLVE